jgi:hypothetical protein
MMKKYFIRAVKYTVYYYVLLLIFLLLMYLLHVMEGDKVLELFICNGRLLTGIVILGLVYPVVGFKRLAMDLPDGGREKHSVKIIEAIELNGFRLERSEGDVTTFVARNSIRRMLNMYEERVTLEFVNSTSIKISGLRRDIGRIQLRINSYVRYA